MCVVSHIFFIILDFKYLLVCAGFRHGERDILGTMESKETNESQKLND